MGVGVTDLEVEETLRRQGLGRIGEDRLVEHWPVVDTYRILVAIGAVTLSAMNASCPPL